MRDRSLSHFRRQIDGEAAYKPWSDMHSPLPRRLSPGRWQCGIVEIGQGWEVRRASRTSTGRKSTPNDGATTCIALDWAGPAELDELRRTATRLTAGTIS